MISYKRALSLSQLKSGGSFNILDFVPANDSVFFAASARCGLEACLDLLGMSNKDSVLLPAFVAQGVINPFQRKKINIVYYKSKADLKINAEDIRKKITNDKSVKCIVIIHYFGFPQDVNSIKSFCEEHGVVVMEDCAQALFSRNDDGKLLGSFGDISFFSLPKTLPVPDGSIFIVNNPKYKFITEKIKSSYSFSMVHKMAVFYHLYFLLLKNIQLKLNYSVLYKILNFKAKALYALYYYFLRKIHKPVMISKTSMKILANIDYAECIQKRTNHIGQVYNKINRSSYKLLYPDCNSNYVLTGVPLMSDKRDAIVKTLRAKRNIECLCYLKGWYFFPKDLSGFRNEIDVYNKHYLLPIKEDVDIKYLTDAVSEGV